MTSICENESQEMECDNISFLHWISQMEDAQEEAKQVYKLNEPSIKNNIVIKKQNVEAGEYYTKMLPMPAKLGDWSQEILQREAIRMKKLGNIKPEEWENRISKVKKNARGNVAKIIWWDFFGDVEVTDRWPHLDKWINVQFKDIPIEDTITGLNIAGYSPWQIKKRLNF